MSGRGSAIDGVPMWALVVGECAIVSLAAVLWAVPHWCYRLVLRKQVAYVTGRNNTAVVLALRSALILPLMATTTLIPLMVPRTFQGCELVQSVIEGYAVKCFFILVVKNVGGSGGAIRLLRRSRVCTGCGLFRSDDDEDPGCCLEYILGGARGLYAKTALAVWAFAYIRPLIVVVETAFFYSPQVGNFDYAITGLLGAAITFIMVPLLLTLVYAAMDECEGIQILYKFTVVKVVVGLILAENFLRDVLYANDRLRLGPETRGGLVPGPNSSVLNTYVRAYCSVALVQLALLSCLLDLGYGVEMALGDGALDLKSDTTPRTEDDLWRDVFYVQSRVFFNRAGLSNNRDAGNLGAAKCSSSSKSPLRVPWAVGRMILRCRLTGMRLRLSWGPCHGKLGTGADGALPVSRGFDTLSREPVSREPRHEDLCHHGDLVA